MLSFRDTKIIWHPFTQEQTASSVIPIKHGAGSYLYDEHGHKYCDLISSWWVNLHGHGHPEIALSIYEQALNLEHVIFAGFTHSPAVTLCEKLNNILPSNLKRFFFSDNGSTAVEVALKMAYQYWINQNIRDRKFFLSFDGGYHGDTFGAMAVGQRSGFHNHFQDLFFQVLSIPYPATWQDDAEIVTKETQALETLEDYLQQFGNQIAALVLEPLIQGAGGMRVCRISFLEQVVSMVKKYNILIILDEVMTGFYRTGTFLALSQLNIEADFLCLSKGITGGFLPLALTVTTDEIYQAFLSEHWHHAFAHGHSYTANPLACAAAITSLEILFREQTQQSIRNINCVHQKFFSSFDLKKIKKLRILGTISAFDIHDDIPMQPLQTKFLHAGLLLRPLGKTIYLMPPYSITADELQECYYTIQHILDL